MQSIILGSIITEDSIMDCVMRESPKEFMNMWAKFLINDFMGMLKKKNKTIEQAPSPLLFRMHLVAYFYGIITRIQLRKYVNDLI